MFKTVGIVTLVACTIAVIAAVIGGLVVIIGPSGALSFEDYLNDMAKFVAGLGLLGIGRGIHLAARDTEIARAKQLRAHV